MTLEEVIHVIEKAEAEGKTTVRLHTEIHVFTVQSVNRWIFWMRRDSLMTTVLVSVHSAVRQVP